MSADPIEKLPIAFGRVLARRRDPKPGTALALAESVGLTEDEVIETEQGQRRAKPHRVFQNREGVGGPADHPAD